MAQNDTHDGGCLCGNLRYRITGPIDSVVHCHCTMCRRAAGAAVVTWLTVPVDRFAYTGGEPATYHSSDHGLRQFCSSCGTPVVFTSPQRPEDVDITLGSLDRPEDHPAKHHVFSANKVPWLHLDEDLPAYSGFSPDADA